MEKLIGVINLDKEHDFLNELTYFRCGAAVPFAGRYRLIDFVMANMFNSDITELAIFIKHKYRSLLDHLRVGKQWNLDRKKGGLFILPPDWHDPNDISMGELRHFHNNMDFFFRSLAEHVLFSGSQTICKIDYRKVLNHHLENKADVTLVYKEVESLEKEHQNCKRLDVDSEGKVVNIHNRHDNKNIFMDMFIIEKDLLIDLVKDCIAHRKADLFENGIMDNIQDLKIASYQYHGYHGLINSIESYYKTSMELLDLENYRELFMTGEGMIPTKVKDEVPTRYIKGSDVNNSLVANGCLIEGKVKNSILFREVHVEKGAKIENSIIMQKGTIGKNTALKNVILDKYVSVLENQTLIGSNEKPYVVAKSQII